MIDVGEGYTQSRAEAAAGGVGHVRGFLVILMIVKCASRTNFGEPVNPLPLVGADRFGYSWRRPKANRRTEESIS